MASGIWSIHSDSPARPVDQRARDTFRSSDRSVCVPGCRLESIRSTCHLPCSSRGFTWNVLRAIALV